MRVFKYRTFRQWAKKEGISNNDLRNAIREIEKGLFDANLGSGLYKQRIARKGQGKRGSYRAILAFKEKERTIFMYGYAKNTLANISEKEEIIYKKLAKYFLNATDTEIKTLIQNGELFEVK